MKVRDLIKNPGFDCNCNYDIFDCTEPGISWHDASPVFSTAILDSEASDAVLDMHITYITLSNGRIIIEASKTARDSVESHPEQPLMAIWHYDNPPYYLASKIKNWYNDGTVTIEGYEILGRVTPIKVLPYDPDRISDLRQIGETHRAAEKDLCSETKLSAEKLLFIK